MCFARFELADRGLSYANFFGELALSEVRVKSGRFDSLR